MSIRAKLQPLVPGFVSAPQAIVRMFGSEVEWSEDLVRVAALPRRSKPNLDELVVSLTAKLKRPEGTQTLRPIQAWMLHEAPLVGGLLGQIAVGAGKSLASYLMPMVMPNCQRAVLLIPPSLRAQFEHDWEEYGKHWKLPNLAGGRYFIPGRPVLHVVAYSELSSPKSTQLLENHLKPDLIIADEAHNFRFRDSSKSIRFLRYVAAHPTVRFCGWSGTITGKSLLDYSHLLVIALGIGSPLPGSQSTVEEWASALDPDGTSDPGALRIFCNKGESVRSGFRRRLIETPGFVATEENQLKMSLVFYKREAPAMPEALRLLFRELRRPPPDGWKRPDGEELVDMLAVQACARQLACGCYYRWKFLGDASDEVIHEWFNRRQDWNRELRARLRHPSPHLDSPWLLEQAAVRWHDGGCEAKDENDKVIPGCSRGPQQHHERGCQFADQLPLWPSVTYPAWRKIENAVEYETEAVWEHERLTKHDSEYLLRDIVAWMAEAPGIVWVEHTAVGQRLSQMTGVPFYEGGDEAARAIHAEKGDRSIIASVDAHRDGRNLQAFNRSLIVSMPASAAHIEQLVGRTHRSGQLADEVQVHYYEHTAELSDALMKAKSKAKYVQETTGSAQKLCYGAWA